MDHPNSSTEHVKGKHLSYDEYHTFQLRLQDGWSANRIAKNIGCAPNTVRNIIKKGLTPLYKGRVIRFKAATAWKKYTENRTHCRRSCDALEKREFLRYVVRHFREDHWSLDACVGRALQDKAFQRSQILCTRSLYNYVDLGLLELKNIDLPQKLHRRTKAIHVRQNKKILGRSIEERPASVSERKEFGHWETDLVIGAKKGQDDVLLTLLERKTDMFFVYRLPDKTAESVMAAFGNIRAELGSAFSRVFKTITTDNGSEFSRLSEIERTADTRIYFAHPYTSYEKGSIENHNGLIRRFIRKGKRIDSYSDEAILGVQMWANSLPRKRLDYHTPEEAFDREMDMIYSLYA